MRRDKSFADDLIVHRGAVSSRVALLLRSAEAKPLMPRFVERHPPLGKQALERAPEWRYWGNGSLGKNSLYRLLPASSPAGVRRGEGSCIAAGPDGMGS